MNSMNGQVIDLPVEPRERAVEPSRSILGELPIAMVDAALLGVLLPRFIRAMVDPKEETRRRIGAGVFAMGLLVLNGFIIHRVLTKERQ